MNARPSRQAIASGSLVPLSKYIDTPSFRAHAKRELEREMEAWIGEHCADVRSRVDCPVSEYEADLALLAKAADHIAEAAKALALISRNTLAGDGSKQSPSAVSDLLQEYAGDVLTPTAAKVLGAMIAVGVA